MSGRSRGLDFDNCPLVVKAVGEDRRFPSLDLNDSDYREQHD